MSTALELIQAQKVAAVENGPTSESFTLDPDGSAVEFKGIFVDDYEEQEKRDGVMITVRGPAILVATVPVAADADDNQPIVYTDGSNFPDGTARKILQRIGANERGISVLWLA